MPYKNPERRAFVQRCDWRTRHHGNWRQIFIDCGGVCTYLDEDGNVCGAVEDLELHEIFGENHGRDDPKFQIRVLRCPYHHSLEPQHNPKSFWGQRFSLLCQDVQKDIEYCGSYDNWIRKYDLIDRWGYSMYPRKYEEEQQIDLGLFLTEVPGI